MTRQEAQKLLGKNYSFIREEEKAYEFIDLSIPEEADSDGIVWVVKNTGELIYNHLEYFDKCGIPKEYPDDDED